MVLLSVAITNLRKYNEGCLDFKWLDLPTSEEEIEKAFEEIGLNEEYEEYFITDYESDFGLKCSEYVNIKELNEKLLELENVSNNQEAKLEAIIDRDYFGEDDLEKIIELMQDDCIDFYENMTGEEYEEQLVSECYDLSFIEKGWLAQYIEIDYERMAREDDSIYETNKGVLVDRR